MKLFAVLVAAVAGIGGVLTSDSEGGRSDVERAISQHMNKGASGTVTRSVACFDVSGGSGDRFRCVLTSTRGSKLVARVRVDGDRWTAAWEPLRG